MHTEISDNIVTRPAGWIYYDGDCAFCRGWLRRVERPLLRRGFQFKTLQSREHARLAGTPNREVRPLFTEMILELPDGLELGGADAAVILARHVWWLWPLWLVGQIPGAMNPLRAGYRFIARNRHCRNIKCKLSQGGKP